VVFLVTGLLVAMAFAVPALLFYRERRLVSSAASQPSPPDRPAVPPLRTP